MTLYNYCENKEINILIDRLFWLIIIRFSWWVHISKAKLTYYVREKLVA